MYTKSAINFINIEEKKKTDMNIHKSLQNQVVIIIPVTAASGIHKSSQNLNQKLDRERKKWGEYNRITMDDVKLGN